MRESVNTARKTEDTAPKLQWREHHLGVTSMAFGLASVSFYYAASPSLHGFFAYAFTAMGFFYLYVCFKELRLYVSQPSGTAGALLLLVTVLLAQGSASVEATAFYNGTNWVLTNDDYNSLLANQGDTHYNITYNYTYNYVTNNVISDPRNCTAELYAKDASIAYWSGAYGEKSSRLTALEAEYSRYRANTTALVDQVRGYWSNLSRWRVNHVTLNADTEGGRAMIDKFAKQHESEPTFYFLSARVEVPRVVEKKVPEPYPVGPDQATARSLDRSTRRLGSLLWVGIIFIAAFTAGSFYSSHRSSRLLQTLLDLVKQGEGGESESESESQLGRLAESQADLAEELRVEAEALDREIKIKTHEPVHGHGGEEEK